MKNMQARSEQESQQQALFPPRSSPGESETEMLRAVHSMPTAVVPIRQSCLGKWLHLRRYECQEGSFRDDDQPKGSLQHNQSEFADPNPHATAMPASVPMAAPKNCVYVIVGRASSLSNDGWLWNPVPSHRNSSVP